MDVRAFGSWMSALKCLFFFPGFRGPDRSLCPRTSAGISGPKTYSLGCFSLLILTSLLTSFVPLFNLNLTEGPLLRHESRTAVWKPQFGRFWRFKGYDCDPNRSLRALRARDPQKVSKKVSPGLLARSVQKVSKRVEMSQKSVKKRLFRDFFETFRLFSRLFGHSRAGRAEDLFETFWGFWARRTRRLLSMAVRVVRLPQRAQRSKKFEISSEIENFHRD